MITNAKELGIRCAAITAGVNIDEVMKSEADVLFIGPEILKLPVMTKSLLRYRSKFICKVVDEAHLGRYKKFKVKVNWKTDVERLFLDWAVFGYKKLGHHLYDTLVNLAAIYHCTVGFHC